MSRILKILTPFALLLLYSVCCKAQDDCGRNTITNAESQYEIGRFNECIESLNHCININGFKDYNDRLQALRLCAMCYLSIDSVKKADQYIEKLVMLDDNFQVDPRDPERFRLQVLYVRTQLRSAMTSSVSKKMENIELAPATIQIITAKDIQDRGYSDIESVFSDLPGFDVTTTFGISYSVLYQRGYRSPSLTERTMILIDGVEDNDIWSNAAIITKQYPISSVKRIEVIYGPASTIYGANAFCGVINIVTKDEDDLFPNNGTNTGKEKKTNIALTAQTGVASYNTRYVDATAAVRNKDVFFSVTGRVFTSDGVNLSSYENWDGVPDFSSSNYASRLTINNKNDTFKSYQKLDPTGQYFTVNADSTKVIPTAKAINKADSLDRVLYKAAAKYANANIFKDPINDFCISAKLTVQNFKFGFQYWNKNEGSAGDYIDNFASPNSAYTNWQIREYFLYARYDKNLNEHTSISSFTYYRYGDYGDNSRTTRFLSYGDGVLTGLNLLANKVPYFSTTNYSQESNQLNSELKLLYVINDKFDVLAGTEFRTGVYQANYLTSTLSPAVTYGTVPDSAGGNNLTEYTISGYVTGTYHDAARKLNIDLGGRVDNNKFRETKGYGTVFNPRIAIVYYPGNFIFKAIYSEAFLDASDLNKFSTSATRLLDNPSLSPEKVRNYEVSARYKFSKKTYLELAGYRAYYTNTLALAQVALANGQVTDQYQDIGKSLVYGLQAASETFVGKNISIYSNLTLTDPKSIFTSVHGQDSTVRTGDIAYVSANAGINIGLLKNKLNVNARLNIVGDKPTGINTSVSTNPLDKIPGYQLINATIGYRIIKNILLQVGCNNILNTLYYSPGVRSADGSQYAPSVPQPLRNYYTRIIVDLKR